MEWFSIAGIKKVLGLNPSDQITGAGRAPNYGYSYAFAFGAIAAGASASVAVKINSSCPFVAMEVAGLVRDAAAARVDLGSDTPELYVTVQTNDGVWSSGEMEWAEFVGTAKDPKWLQFAQTCAAGTTVTITIRNADTASFRPRLLLTGAHIAR